MVIYFGMRKLSWSLCLAMACGGASTRPAPATPAPGDPTEPKPAISLHDSMRDHFADATAARDGVIAGRLDFVHAALRRLAAREQGGDTPEDWRPWLTELQLAAERGTRTTTMEDAASAVAALGANCGQCHRTTRGGLRKSAIPAGYEPGDQVGLEEKMARHQFSADALWLGMTGPAHQDWAQGATALMNIQVPALVTMRGAPATRDRRASGEGTLQGPSEYSEPEPAPASEQPRRDVIDMSAQLRELRELGRSADQAKTEAEKQAVFAQVILRCGTCHAQLGVRPY